MNYRYCYCGYRYRGPYPVTPVVVTPLFTAVPEAKRRVHVCRMVGTTGPRGGAPSQRKGTAAVILRRL